MLEKKDKIAGLITKCLRKELTLEENNAFDQWLSEDERHRELLAEFTDENSTKEKMRAFVNSESSEGWSKVQHYMNTGELPRRQRPVKPIWNYMVAAVTIGIVLLGYLYYSNAGTQKNGEGMPDGIIRFTQGLAKHHAELILENGEKIFLHKKENGLIDTEGAFKVYKNNNDLYYKSGEPGSFQKDLSNTINTYNGSHYRIILPDGSTITMNVASSVELGVSSASAIRQVKLKGEALFVVSPDSTKPFSVTIPSSNKNSGDGTVEVVGTRFNINAYQDEEEKAVTLLDGNLNVYTNAAHTTGRSLISHADYSSQLRDKGQQARWHHDGMITVHRNVDTTEVVGWTNGTVAFNQAPTRKVLNTLERWYDVQIDYATQKIPEFRFTGKITPGTDIKTVLEIMQFQCDSLNVKFDSAQKKLTVLPYGAVSAPHSGLY